MINSIYDAKIMQVYNHKRILSQILKHAVYQPYEQMTTPSGRRLTKAVMVVPSDEYDTLPSFTQPIDMNEGTNKEPMWVVDGRPFLRSGTPPVYVAKNDWTFQCVRLTLIQAMADGAIQPVRLGMLPAKVFSRWIVQSLTQRFNLDMSTQMTVGVICALYYFQMMNKEPLALENFESYASHVSNITGVPRDSVVTTLEGLNKLPHNIDTMIDAIKTSTRNVRLKDLNFTTLFMVLSMSWIGVHSRENIGLALEHGPTFLAMVYSAGDDRSYRKTVITRHVENAGRPADVDAFLKYVSRLVMSYYAD
jgi:hypothetical protein